MRHLFLLFALGLLFTQPVCALTPTDAPSVVETTHPTGSFAIVRLTGLEGSRQPETLTQDQDMLVTINSLGECFLTRSDEPRPRRVPCKVEDNTILLGLNGYHFIRFERTDYGYTTGQVAFSRQYWSQINLIHQR